MILSNPSDAQEVCISWRESGKTIGFVPTMGCLHEGHLSLIKRARESSDKVVVSIFVNPLQFGVNEDFSTYPRPIAIDIEKCQELEVDLVFTPEASSIYGNNFGTRIDSGALGKLYCGKSRPGFFNGVLTVVNILFNIIRPHRAFFGEKDYQQLFLIRQLVRDFWLPIEIIGMPIIREQTGLAMSSRNKYLADKQRELALCLSQAITATNSAVKNGNREAESVLRVAIEKASEHPEFSLDYVHLVKESNLLPFEDTISEPARLLLAGYIGDSPRVRLIDNARIN